jgi:hypothetical protein
MKKSFVTHIIVMIAAVILGSFLASTLMTQQAEISNGGAASSTAPLGGFNKFASDIQWMLLINYAGGLDVVENESSDEVCKRLDAILSNDPNLEIAYNVGGMMISNSNPVKAAEIFMRGANNPNLKNSWQIPFSAGFILDRYVTDQQDPQRLKKAEDMFRLAASRDQSLPHITSALVRTRAKRILEKGKWNGAPVVNLEHAQLCALYDEWKKNGGNEVGGSESLAITDIKPRILKAAQDAKNTDPGNKDILGTVDKVTKAVLEDEHLCGNCLAPFAAGDKYCAQCGLVVTVYAVCPNLKCNAVMKGKYCSQCGNGEKSK